MYDKPGVKPCKTPNCGRLNCKRLPCKYDGYDLGLGKWPKNHCLNVFPMKCWILIKSIIPKFVIIIFIREKVIILFVWKEAILLWCLLFKQWRCNSPPLIIFFGRWKWNENELIRTWSVPHWYSYCGMSSHWWRPAHKRKACCQFSILCLAPLILIENNMNNVSFVRLHWISVGPNYSNYLTIRIVRTE